MSKSKIIQSLWISSVNIIQIALELLHFQEEISEILSPFDDAVDFIWKKINELCKGKWRKTKKKIFDYVMNDLIAYMLADVNPKYSLLYQKLNEEEKEKFCVVCNECKNIYFSTTFEESQKIFAFAYIFNEK